MIGSEAVKTNGQHVDSDDDIDRPGCVGYRANGDPCGRPVEDAGLFACGRCAPSMRRAIAFAKRQEEEEAKNHAVGGTAGGVGTNGTRKPRPANNMGLNALCKSLQSNKAGAAGGPPGLGRGDSRGDPDLVATPADSAARAESPPRPQEPGPEDVAALRELLEGLKLDKYIEKLASHVRRASASRARARAPCRRRASRARAIYERVRRPR